MVEDKDKDGYDPVLVLEDIPSSMKETRFQRAWSRTYPNWYKVEQRLSSINQKKKPSSMK
jgi:hypothetical protein